MADEQCVREKETVPAWLEQERSKWYRFELTATRPEQVYALNSILEKTKLSRYELAVIVASLRVRPGFSLEDFCT